MAVGLKAFLKASYTKGNTCVSILDRNDFVLIASGAALQFCDKGPSAYPCELQERRCGDKNIQNSVVLKSEQKEGVAPFLLLPAGSRSIGREIASTCSPAAIFPC